LARRSTSADTQDSTNPVGSHYSWWEVHRHSCQRQAL
jgi:hypothetical protein